MNTIEKAVRRLAQKRAQADVDKEDLEASSVADELGYPAGIAMTASSAQAVGTGTAGSQDTGGVLGAQQALADERVARTIPAESGAAEDFEPSDYRRSPDLFMAEIQGRLTDGTWVSGVEVFRRIYSAIGLGPLTWLTRLPIISGLLDRAYRLFARNRLRLTGRCSTS